MRESSVSSSTGSTTPGADTGYMLVQFRKPTNQIFTNRYAVKVDDRPALVVNKQCDANIKLDAGKHALKFYVTSNEPDKTESVTFGTATKSEIVIVKDKVQTLKYTGPWRLFGSGSLDEVK